MPDVGMLRPRCTFAESAIADRQIALDRAVQCGSIDKADPSTFLLRKRLSEESLGKREHFRKIDQRVGIKMKYVKSNLAKAAVTDADFGDRKAVQRSEFLMKV